MSKYTYPESIQAIYDNDQYSMLGSYGSACQRIDVAFPTGVHNAICLRDVTALFLRCSRIDLDTVGCTRSDCCVTSLALYADDSHCDVVSIVCVTFHLRRNDIPY